LYLQDDFLEQWVALTLGHINDPDQTDVPSNSAKLCFPTGVTAQGACLYVAEHPSESQGAIFDPNGAGTPAVK